MIDDKAQHLQVSVERQKRGIELAQQMEHMFLGEHITTVLSAMVFMLFNQAQLMQQQLSKKQYAEIVNGFVTSLISALEYEDKHETTH